MSNTQTQRSKVAGFQFKQFSIAQCNTAMKVSTDGIMLGAWADVTHKQRILDVGTGTGLLALMVKQRQLEAVITAIDIEADAIAQAAQNIVTSPWPDIKVEHVDAIHFNSNDRFDLIVSNPPYFEDALKAQDVKRNLARHTDSLQFFDLIQLWQRVGSSSCELAVILPAEQGKKFRSLAFENGAHLSRLCEVRTTQRKAISRWLMQFSWDERKLDEQELVIHTGDDYSEDYQRLCKDFYLRF
ncbi:tRNA1(Val) (adenine(37)-N6)-methyltransferase [Pseudoalteromonas pernae]|uniref:tRNA1(Val) (adenine(37)-N6)-methyltransferase n=1 Tax=Pseudoalteromonas pernae TaxID=3118054 RepID=UPI0032428525